MTWTVDVVDSNSLNLDEVLDVYRSSGLGDRRPVDDPSRFARMMAHANLLVTCRSMSRLVGIARCLSDFSYVTYVSDIAVAGAFQRHGIGRALIDSVRAAAPEAKIVLLSAPAASEYYPHIGFMPHPSAWTLEPEMGGPRSSPPPP